ncbi:MAG TPA: hypothetical protein VLH39_02375 [Magnetospirillaceae bacterium]|nr:hypothetical protein [Magnetospirillaceae bacterium]
MQRLFPDLRYGEDPDIQRYFGLRSAGRIAEALSVYDRGLRARYPDDDSRIALLNLYRRRDPRFAVLHDDLLWVLYRSVSARLRANLDALCAPLAGLSLRSTYRMLKAMETVAGMLPDNPDGALAYLDAYRRYAEILDYRAAEARRLRFLAGEYFAQASGREPEETDFLARSLAQAERRRELRRAQAGFFDLSRIGFSARDVERIEIPASLERKEDRVLAYCFKYWACAGDPSFERIVFLYSRKYGTSHYDVLRAIRMGRERRLTDDEILNRVSTALSARYSYSVQGDLYMQRAWRVLKARLLGLESPSAGDQTDKGPPKASQDTGPSDTGPSDTGPSDAGLLRSGPASAGARKAAVRSVNAQAQDLRRGGRPPDGGRTRNDSPDADLLRKAAPARRVSLAPMSRPSGLSAPGGSVSDRIKLLSGRSYDVYREEFLARSGPVIRDWLAGRRRGHKELFEDPINRAEDLIRDFLEKNYSNPYMDWGNSETRALVDGLGFDVPDLDGIISLWFHRRGR